MVLDIYGLQGGLEEWRKAEAETVRADHEARRAEELARSANATAAQVAAAKQLR